MTWNPIVKLRSWLHRWIIGAHHPTLHSGEMTQEQAAINIAERARLGDQVAYAIICEVRDRAAAGDPTAKKSYDFLMKYTSDGNPHQNLNHYDASVGEEEAAAFASRMCGEEPFAVVVHEEVPKLASVAPLKAVVALAEGPSLLPQPDGTNLIREVGEAFDNPDEEQAFILGAKFCQESLHAMRNMSPEEQNALLLGVIMGNARRMQAMRDPNIPVSSHTPSVGWELGENC